MGKDAAGLFIMHNEAEGPGVYPRNYFPAFRGTSLLRRQNSKVEEIGINFLLCSLSRNTKLFKLKGTTSLL